MIKKPNAARFSVDKLIETAQVKAACGEPSDLDTPGLHALCGALDTISDQFNFIGRMRAELLLTETLVKRLRTAHHLTAQPEILDETLATPIVLVAPPRTGTTLLHRLLTLDPAHRAPRLWEVLQAPPLQPELRGDPRYLTDDYRIPIARRYLKAREQSTGNIAAMHPSGADLPEECFGLLETSLTSHSFMFYGPVIEYLDWLDNRTFDDWLAVYRLYVEQLKLLQWWWPGDRWVLKTPFHLWAVDALVEAIPNAVIVQQHRAPSECVASFCSLTATAYRPIMHELDQPAIGRLALRYLRDALTRNATARARLKGACFVDIDYDALIQDPIACVKRVYQAAGAKLSTHVEIRMHQWLTAQAAGRAKNGHTYSLDDYSLNIEEVNEAFAPYTAFNIAG